MQDFRNEDPVWVKYAEFVGQGSDKFYETTIHFGDDGMYYLQKRWGARPDTGAGQIKVETYQNLNSAQAMANDIFRQKVRKGYAVVERPYSASLKVPKEYISDDEDY
jgi:predicted DNA-binding WGR domain protein